METNEIIQKILRGTTEVINIENLEKKIQSKKVLRIKAGFDPTAPDIHLGHVVLLRKLRHFQDLGHQVDFVIGDFTALIGDPSGRNQLRPRLEPVFIAENAKTYKNQALKILKEEQTNFIENSQWLGELTPATLLSLTSRCTVAQMLARADFKKRFEDNIEISIMEFIYPLLQGFDSYALKSDIELGGADQKFNLLMGRQIQEALVEDWKFTEIMNCILKNQVQDKLGTYMTRLCDVLLTDEFKAAQEPQVIIMMPLLEGTDGVQKMSKSSNNYIGISESSDEIFGKVMSISDDLMMKYYEYLTDFDFKEIKELHPKEAKLKLAEEIVHQFHSNNHGLAARNNFERTFSLRDIPEKIDQFDIKTSSTYLLLDVLIEARIVFSKNEARRLIKQGAISHDGIKINDENWLVQKGILKVGKRRFLRLI